MTEPEHPSITDEAAARSSFSELLEMVGALKKERDDNLEQLMRSRAEFANYQKRAKAQADADRQYLVGGLAKDLLDVLDNFERTLDAARASGASAIVSGMELVSKQFTQALAKHGIEAIAALGKPFDPLLHEAVARQPSDSAPEGSVVAELSKGYRMGDRTLRPAKVAVAVPAAAAGTQPFESH